MMRYKVEVDVYPDGTVTIESWRYPGSREELMDVRDMRIPKIRVEDPDGVVVRLNPDLPGSRTTVSQQAHIALQRAIEKDRKPLEVIDHSTEEAA